MSSPWRSISPPRGPRGATAAARAHADLRGSGQARAGGHRRRQLPDPVPRRPRPRDAALIPDEYIYASISRSLAEHGRPLIRSAPAHFPAVLEPLAAAPFWLFHDPALAYRLTQMENALAMSLAAIPVYLLSRRVGLGAGLALVAAALAVASPDLFFASFVLADRSRTRSS